MVDLATEQPGQLLSRAPERVRSPRLFAAAVVLQVIFTAADLFAHIGLGSVLYCVPLVLLVWSGYDRRLRWVAAGLVVLNYVVYYIKVRWLSTTVPAPELFDFKLINRTVVAVMLCALELLLEFRVATEFLRSDRDLPEPFRREEDETDETAAVFIAATATAVIFAVDLPTPANVDLAVLYMIPLFLCAWSRNRKLLWSMAMAALVLSALGYVLGPPPTKPSVIHFPVNRVLTGVVTILMTVLLHFRGGLTNGRPNRRSDIRRRTNGAPQSRVG